MNGLIVGLVLVLVWVLTGLLLGTGEASNNYEVDKFGF